MIRIVLIVCAASRKEFRENMMVLNKEFQIQFSLSLFLLNFISCKNMAFFSATRAATRSPFLTSRNTISRSILPTFRSLSISSPAYNKPPRVESDLTHPALLKDPPISNPSSETDPWSLVPPPPPEAPTGMEGMTIEELIASPHPEGRDSESTETLRKRLVYESRKRGILETDLILATFAMERLGSLTDRELREYDRVRSFPFFDFLLETELTDFFRSSLLSQIGLFTTTLPTKLMHQNHGLLLGFLLN